MDDSTLKDLEKYHAAVKLFFDDESEVIFPNNASEHSAVIIEEILLHAKKNVKVFCRRLSADVWNGSDVSWAFFKAVARGVKVEIITQEEPDDKCELTKLIKLLKINLRQNIGNNIKCNFIVADRKMFRFEEDADERHAFACANCVELASKLDDYFATIA